MQGEEGMNQRTKLILGSNLTDENVFLHSKKKKRIIELFTISSSLFFFFFQLKENWLSPGEGGPGRVVLRSVFGDSQIFFQKIIIIINIIKIFKMKLVKTFNHAFISLKSSSHLNKNSPRVVPGV